MPSSSTNTTVKKLNPPPKNQVKTQSSSSSSSTNTDDPCESENPYISQEFVDCVKSVLPGLVEQVNEEVLQNEPTDGKNFRVVFRKRAITAALLMFNGKKKDLIASKTNEDCASVVVSSLPNKAEDIKGYIHGSAIGAISDAYKHIGIAHAWMSIVAWTKTVEMEISPQILESTGGGLAFCFSEDEARNVKKFTTRKKPVVLTSKMPKPAEWYGAVAIQEVQERNLGEVLQKTLGNAGFDLRDRQVCDAGHCRVYYTVAVSK